MSLIYSSTYNLSCSLDHLFLIISSSPSNLFVTGIWNPNRLMNWFSMWLTQMMLGNWILLESISISRESLNMSDISFWSHSSYVRMALLKFILVYWLGLSCFKSVIVKLYFSKFNKPIWESWFKFWTWWFTKSSLFK